jgi:hypothetical protein
VKREIEIELSEHDLAFEFLKLGASGQARFLCCVADHIEAHQMVDLAAELRSYPGDERSMRMLRALAPPQSTIGTEPK